MEFMEPEFNQSAEELSNFEKSMEARTKEFASIPKEFDDLVPGAKEKAIQEAKNRAIESTSSFFQKKQNEVSEKLQKINALIAKEIYPLRSSMVPSEVASGEAQFQSALALVNTKNVNLIIGELRLAAAANRVDFIFSVFELTKSDDHFNQDYKRELVSVIQSLHSAKNYSFLLAAQENLNEIFNQINFYKRNMSSGNLPGGYAINKAIRDRKSGAFNEIVGRS